MKRRVFVKNSTLTAFGMATVGAINWNGKSFEGDTETTSQRESATG
jgi:phosphatidylserine/phosphatidylglycerophosphate/cardiolipin synthase-like enzyme